MTSLEHAPSIAVRPFDPVRDMVIVGDNFHRSLRGGWPWRLVRVRTLMDEIRSHLESPGVRAVVAPQPGNDRRIMGWCLAIPERNELVFAYVGYPYRREFGTGTALLMAAGLDLTRPIPVRFWTRASERMSLKTTWAHPWSRWTANLRATVIEAEDEKKDGDHADRGGQPR